MGKEIATIVQETQRVPNRISPRQNTPRHILIKLTKIKHKEQILKAEREKQEITHICRKSDACASLNGDYAAFGYVVYGIDVVDSVATVTTNANDKPLTDVVIESIRFVNVD